MAKVVSIGYLTPISAEEMLPSKFFFSKKRRVVVRREMHQMDGVNVKKHRVLLYGQAQEEEEFTIEVTGSLGDFATTNQFSVSNLKEKLKQKDMLISQLKNQVKMVENIVRSEMDKDFKQIRASDGKEIQQLKYNLDEMQKNSQTNDELVRQLQVKVSVTEKEVVDISIFQTQTLEVHKELEST
jgi:hypothetical protein